MGLEFYNTVYGRDFFQFQLPDLIDKLGRIADALEDRKDSVQIMQCIKDVMVDTDKHFEKGKTYFFVPTKDKRYYATYMMNSISEGRCWEDDKNKYFKELRRDEL